VGPRERPKEGTTSVVKRPASVAGSHHQPRLFGAGVPPRAHPHLTRLARTPRHSRRSSWLESPAHSTLRRRSTRCLPSAAATARLLGDDRDRAHRGHDSGLFPSRPPHPQERPGHAGHNPIAGSPADLPRRDLHAITNDCHIPNRATARRVWSARSRAFCPQTLLATVQRAELEGWNARPWMARDRRRLLPQPGCSVELVRSRSSLPRRHDRRHDHPRGHVWAEGGTGGPPALPTATAVWADGDRELGTSQRP